MSNKLGQFQFYDFLHSQRFLIKKLYTTLERNADFSMKYSVMCKVNTDEGGIKQSYHGLSACAGDTVFLRL